MSRYIEVENLEVSSYVTVWDCNCSEYGKQTVMAVDDLLYLPSVDAVEVVRCNDCKYCYSPMADDTRCFCLKHGLSGIIAGKDYCSYGERKPE